MLPILFVPSNRGAAGGTPPVADFSGTPLIGTWMFTTAFTDLSTGNPTSWLWEAKQDDGEWFAFNEYNTGVTFEFEDFHVGVHSIRLTVTNAHGSDTMTKMNYITVNDVP